MSAKLQINMLQGTIEVEGSEEFVSKIYDDFKSKIGSNFVALPTPQNVPPLGTSSSGFSQNSGEPNAGKSKTKKSTSTPSKETLEVVKEFANGDEGKKFLEIMTGYENPKSHQKKITLFIYIMQQIGLSNITVNHVFTCYRLLKDTTPGNIRQAIIDAKNKNFWLINDSWEDLKVHHKGEEMVEQNLVLNSNQ